MADIRDSQQRYGPTDTQQRRGPAVFISFQDDAEQFAPVLSQISATEPSAGQQIEGYKIIDKVGEGAMAVVYRAVQLATNRIVAIKTLRYSETDLSERFAREVSIHNQLKHKNIVEAIECIQSKGRAYFVMELLKGVNLEDQLVNQGRCHSPALFGRILGQICDALECAHSLGIIHRDLKPENIILLEGGKNEIKVLDFGVAKIQEDLQRLTKTGVVLGSPAYMSPEQCMGLKLDARSDLYSLGVVAYELLTGHLPYDATNPVEMMEIHCDPDIVPKPLTAFRPDLPAVEKLQAVFDHVLQTETEDRTADVHEFKKELHDWWEAASNGTSQLPNPFRPSEFPREKKAEKSKSIVNTVEAKALAELTGRRTSADEIVEATPKIPQKMQMPLIIGIVVTVLVALIAFLATFLLSALNGR